MGLRNREENSVLPERCGIRMYKLAGLQSLGAFAPTFFRDVKSAESSPWQSLMPGEPFLPATRSLTGAAWTVTRDTRLLPGLQIWGLMPEFAATFWTGFSFQKIFRERLFSGKRTTDETPTSPCPKAIRRQSRHLPFQLEEMSAPRCSSQIFLFYFRPQKPFSLS